MICKPVLLKAVWRCPHCGRDMPPNHPNVRRRCKRGGPQTYPTRDQLRLPEATKQEIAQQAKARGMLVGDLIAELTKAVGIKPCGGCEKRRQWMNKVHAWLRGRAEEGAAQ